MHTNHRFVCISCHRELLRMIGDLREGNESMYPIIRLERIELKNFKNVKQGMIENTEYRNKLFYTRKANVMGIYGQNGSGKTAVVEAMNVLKLLMSGESLPQEAKYLIHKDTSEAILKFIFYIEDRNEKEDRVNRYVIYYDVTLALEAYGESSEQKLLHVSKEALSYSNIGVKAKADIIRYEYDNEETIFLPKVRVQEVTKQNADALIQLEVAKRMSLKESCSFLFHQDVLSVFQQEFVNPEYGRILSLLRYYAKMNLFVIANRNIAESGISYMPISFRITLEDMVSSGVAPISLTGPSVIKTSTYELVRLVMNQLNLVVGSILPGMYLEVKDLGKELAEDGSELKRVELVSVKDGLAVPLKYESEGIKKILSILSTLISVYNNPSICLVVDELDAGIFEYLLGELLAIIEKHGQGQLIFTSHNLRALEKLHKDAIVVSTSNPHNRFVRIPHEKGDKNYRNTYLRSIDLGGVDEEIYQTTNSYEISYAFKKAGDLFETE